mmetsp:Transcript_24469/g.43359  ORF Transcript_24469/g.43359 Transcript_24469/m.43359 type:complete len:304 (+) Transcript_24469:137-1048(+)
MGQYLSLISLLLMAVRLSATLLLLRDCPSDFEVLLINRSQNLSLAGLFLFPGGKLDEEDSSPEILDYFGIQAAPVPYVNRAQMLEMASLKICGLRETYEETGILIGNPNVVASLPFREICKQVKEKPCLRDLRFFLRIVTPKGLPAPADASFFITQVPYDSQVTLNPTESSEFLWVKPFTALKMYEECCLKLASPQVLALYLLAHFDSIEGLLEAVSRVEYEVDLPEISQEDHNLCWYKGDFRHTQTPLWQRAAKCENWMHVLPVENSQLYKLDSIKPDLTASAPYALEVVDGVLMRKPKARL